MEGSEDSVSSSEFLDRHGVGAVVCLALNCTSPHLTAPQIENLLLHVPDEATVPLIQSFPEACRFLKQQEELGRVTIVHCNAGLSRSATIVLAYVMWLRRLTFHEAVALVLERRAIRPNPGFTAQLKLWESSGYDANARHPELELMKRSRLVGELRKLFLADKLTDDQLPSLENPTDRTGDVAGLRWACAECGTDLADEQHLLGHPETCLYLLSLPLAWMHCSERPSGTVHCPQCHMVLGRYSWFDLPCPACGLATTPAFYLQRSALQPA